MVSPLGPSAYHPSVQMEISVDVQRETLRPMRSHSVNSHRFYEQSYSSPLRRGDSMRGGLVRWMAGTGAGHFACLPSIWKPATGRPQNCNAAGNGLPPWTGSLPHIGTDLKSLKRPGLGILLPRPFTGGGAPRRAGGLLYPNEFTVAG